MKIILLFIFIMIIGCSKPINNSTVVKTTKNTITPTSKIIVCQDTHSYNVGKELPCICFSNYTVNSNGDFCGKNDFSYLQPQSLSYFSTLLQYYKSQPMQITPLISNCTDSIDCTFDIQPALPSGMMFDTLTGSISGTPTDTNYNNFVYVISVSNQYGKLTQTLFLKVLDFPPSNVSFNNTSFQLNTTINEQILYTSGIGSITNITITPTLPSGVNLVKENSNFYIRGVATNVDNTTYTVKAIGPYGMISNTTLPLTFDNTIDSFTISHPNCINNSNNFECTLEYGVHYDPIFFISNSFYYALTSNINITGLTINKKTISFTQGITSHDCYNVFCTYQLSISNGLTTLNKILKIKVIDSLLSPSFSYSNLELFKNDTQTFSPIFNIFPDCYGNINCFSSSNYLINSYTGDVTITDTIVGIMPITIIAHDSRGNITYNANVKIKKLLPILTYQLPYYEVGDTINLPILADCSNVIDSFILEGVPAGLTYSTVPFDCLTPVTTIIGSLNTPYNGNVLISACNDSGCTNNNINIVINPKIKKVVGGLHHACMLTLDGNVYCWGSNEYGQQNISSDNCGNVNCNKRATLLLNNIVDISNAENFLCFLDNIGIVSCQGKGFMGSEIIKITEKIVKIDSGKEDVCMLSENNNLFCKGIIFGDLKIIKNNIIDFTMGENHVCYFDALTLECNGLNDKGQLGSSNSLISINSININPPFDKILAGKNHSCVIKNNISYCWGDNSLKQLVDNNNQTISLIQYDGLVFLNSDRTYINNNVLGSNIISNITYDFVSHVDSDFYCAKDPNLKCYGSNQYGQSSQLIFN